MSQIFSLQELDWIHMGPNGGAFHAFFAFPSVEKLTSVNKTCGRWRALARK